ncbi:MAG: hypothetical protein ACPGKS_04475, partial [Coraliomargarita sp.]
MKIAPRLQVFEAENSYKKVASGPILAFVAVMRSILLFVSIFPIVAALHGFHSIDLKDGGALRGEIVVDRQDAYYVDLGFDVIEVPKAAVFTVSEIDAETGAVASPLTANRARVITGWMPVRPSKP